MTLEQLVTDLATSQRLRDAGLPQDTALVWVIPIGIMGLPIPYVALSSDSINHHFKCVAAPTAGELEEWLMDKGYKFRCAKNLFGAYAIVASKLDEDEDDEEHHPYDGYNEKHVAALAALVLEVVG